MAAKLIALRWPLLLIGLLILGLAYPTSQRLGLDRTIASMFPPDDPSYQAYRHLQDSFGGNAVAMLVYKDSELTSDAGVARNRILTNRVASVPGVKGVLSPSVLSDAIQKLQPMSMFTKTPSLFRKGDKVAEGFDELFAGYTHSRDHSHAAVVAILEPDHPPRTIEQLKEITASLQGGTNRQPDSQTNASPSANVAAMANQAVLVGEPVLVHDGFDLIEKDGARLATMTVLLLSVVVLLSLVDFRFVVLSTMLILWATVVTRASMVVLGSNLSIVSTILTAIITVISVTAVLHIGVRFRTARSRGQSQQRAATGAIAVLFMPILWTCLTDAAGFAALYVSQILPIREFGIMIAISAVAVCMALVLFTPAVLLLPGIRVHHQLDYLQKRLAAALQRRCMRIADGAIRSPGTCLGVAILMAAIAAVGLGKAETETSFLNNFHADSDVVSAYREVETHLGGAGVWDVILDAPNELTSPYLEQVRELENDLRKIRVNGERLTKVLSLADADQVASRSVISAMLPPSSRLSAMSVVMPVFFDALLTRSAEDNRKLRIMLRSREQLDAQTKTALITEVEQVVKQHLSSETWKTQPWLIQTDTLDQEKNSRSGDGRVTGYYVIMAQLINQLVRDQWRCFLMSGILIWILLWLATGSLRLAFVALIPNLLPVFLVLALVGFSGGKINMGAAMIAAVSVGLSIDGSVHFLAAYQRFRVRSHGPRDSARHAAGKMGVPILLATVALIAGFGVMSTSEFIPTATFGVLVASTLAIGTVVNLTLLPAFVAWADQKQPSAT